MSSHSHNSNNQTKRIDFLFSRFAAFYGHTWRSQFKAEGFLEFAKKEWQDGLKEFTDTILNKAILECRDSCELPPTLPHLIQRCRQINKRSRFYVIDKTRALAKQEIVVTQLKKCKEILTGK